MLPYPDFGVDHQVGHFHMRKIDILGTNTQAGANLQAYDCSLGFKCDATKVTEEIIEEGLEFIDVVLHRLAFSLDSKIEWFIKYNYSDSSSGIKQISVDDCDRALNVVCKFKESDSLLLDVAVSWYLDGNRATSPFSKYLNYYVALEGLALKLFSGEMEASAFYGIKRKSKRGRKEEREKCIKTLFDSKGISNITEEDIKKAYSGCILGNYKKTLDALILVFGEDSSYVKEFSDRVNKPNLYDLRNNIAHGAFTLLDAKHVLEIEERLPDLKRLVKNFILRVLNNVKQEEKLEHINPSFSVSVNLADPRATGLFRGDSMRFPHNDWKIRIEWLF